jgi:hypothetical protein
MPLSEKVRWPKKVSTIVLRRTQGQAAALTALQAFSIKNRWFCKLLIRI